MRQRQALALAIVTAALLLLWGCGDDPPVAPTSAGRGFDERYFVFQRDLFPTLNDPETVSASAADFLEDDDEVVGFLHEGAARAYPVFMLPYYHSVNDHVGGRPVLMTFCTICSSAAAYDPDVEGRRLTFGFEGIHRGTPVLYDHQTNSRWFHLDGRCFEGFYAGTVLEDVPGVRYTTWREWRSAHPDTDVVAPPPDMPEKFLVRDPTYRGAEYVPLMMDPTIVVEDDRLPPFELLFGIVVGDTARAYPLDAVAEAGGVVTDTLDSQPISLWLDPASGAAVVFDPRHEGRTLTFTWTAEGTLQDLQTGSTWNLDGWAVGGVLEGALLKPVRGLQAEWYGWVATWPETSLWTAR